jgi:hypothetical protein
MSDSQTQLKYVLARYSALTADSAVSCAIITNKTTVRVGEQFTFAWFSTGMNQQTAQKGPAWNPFGVITMALSKPGMWTYTLKFYDAAGNEVPCSTSIVAT